MKALWVTPDRLAARISTKRSFGLAEICTRHPACRGKLVLTSCSISPSSAVPSAVQHKPVPSTKHDRNFHLVLHSIYRQPVDATVESLKKLEVLTEQRLDELNSESLVTVLYAFARTQPLYTPSNAIVSRFLDATQASMHEGSFTPRQLQHTITCVDSLGMDHDLTWADDFAHAVHTQILQFSNFELLETLTHAARAGVSVPPSALSSLLELCSRELPYWQAGRVGEVLWVLGHYGCQCVGGVVCLPAPDRDDATTSSSSSSSTTGSSSQASGSLEARPAAMGSLVGSAASLGRVDEAALLAAEAGAGARCQLYEADMVSAASSSLPAMQPGEVVHALHGLAAMGAHVPKEMISAVLAALPAPVLGQLGCRELSMLLWALLRVGAQPGPEWLAACTSAVQDNIALASTALQQQQQHHVAERGRRICF
mmetsp:Transcript_20748/g.45372  ORF Transcript_20748/g.45372 Transcript_20748/m.45372 type:complete len:427 (+) Transcript_20748:203-1483(+)